MTHCNRSGMTGTACWEDGPLAEAPAPAERNLRQAYSPKVVMSKASNYDCHPGLDRGLAAERFPVGAGNDEEVHLFLTSVVISLTFAYISAP